MPEHGLPVPLRVLPGLGLDHRSWTPTLSALGVSDEVVLTAPAFGLPSARGADLAPAALAERVVESLPAAGQVVLAGHSSSCQVVAHVARAAPLRVAGLVLVGPTTDPRAATWPRLARRWLATAAHEDPRQVPLLVRQYAATGLTTMARAMDRAREDRLDLTLAHLPCPVLVVRGRHDRICPPDWASSLSPDSVTLAAGGHMVPWTHGLATGREIRRFLGG